MSDSESLEEGYRRRTIAGGLFIVFAILLTAVYQRVSWISALWSYSVHTFFRLFLVTLMAIGVVQLLRGLVFRRTRIPSWLRLSQHWMSIPLEGWIYLGIMFVIFTGAMLTKQNTLLLVFAFMAGPFVINGWMTFGMLQAARVGRVTPHRAMQGESFSVDLTLTNGRPLFALWMMTVRDEIDHARERLVATVLFSRVSPRTSQTGQYQLQLAYRGRYRLGPLRVASRFPLGLVERSRAFSLYEEFLVYPRIGRIAPNWRRQLTGSTELVNRSHQLHGVFHDDFHRLREFRAGDNPRAIHWRSTARRGELVLREFHQNREHALALVLDLFSTTPGKVEDQQLADDALSFVASLLVERGRESREGYMTLAASGEQMFQWEGSSNNLEPLLDGLATLEPGPSLYIVDVLSETLQHATPSTQILLVTTRSSTLPYQSLLTSRVEVLNLAKIAINQLVDFDDQPDPASFPLDEEILNGTPWESTDAMHH